MISNRNLGLNTLFSLCLVHGRLYLRVSSVRVTKVTLLLMTSSCLIVLAHYQVIFVNVTLMSYNSKVEMLVLQAQRRFTAHKTFSVIEKLSAEINSTEMRLPRQEMTVICTAFL